MSLQVPRRPSGDETLGNRVKSSPGTAQKSSSKKGSNSSTLDKMTSQSRTGQRGDSAPSSRSLGQGQSSKDPGLGISSRRQSLQSRASSEVSLVPQSARRASESNVRRLQSLLGSPPRTPAKLAQQGIAKEPRLGATPSEWERSQLKPIGSPSGSKAGAQSKVPTNSGNPYISKSSSVPNFSKRPETCRGDRTGNFWEKLHKDWSETGSTSGLVDKSKELRAPQSARVARRNGASFLSALQKKLGGDLTFRENSDIYSCPSTPAAGINFRAMHQHGRIHFDPVDHFEVAEQAPLHDHGRCHIFNPPDNASLLHHHPVKYSFDPPEKAHRSRSDYAKEYLNGNLEGAAAIPSAHGTKKNPEYWEKKHFLGAAARPKASPQSRFAANSMNQKRRNRDAQQMSSGLWNC